MGAAAPGLTACSARDASGAPALEADETVSLTQTAVALHIGDAPATPPGTLYVTTRCVAAQDAARTRARKCSSQAAGGGCGGCCCCGACVAPSALR